MISYFVDLPESLIFKALAGIKVLLSLTDISCLVVKNDRARVVELVDTQDLGSCAAMRGGSEPEHGNKQDTDDSDLDQEE